MIFFCVYSVLTKGLEPGELLQVLYDVLRRWQAVGLFLLPSGIMRWWRCWATSAGFAQANRQTQAGVMVFALRS